MLGWPSGGAIHVSTCAKDAAHRALERIRERVLLGAHESRPVALAPVFFPAPDGRHPSRTLRHEWLLPTASRACGMPRKTSAKEASHMTVAGVIGPRAGNG